MPEAQIFCDREQQLRLWVAKQLDQNPSTINLEAISGDAGFRRYFRFNNPSIWLAVDAPPQTEDSTLFVKLARYLSEHQVNTPNIFAANENHGFLLVEDFGDKLLYHQLTTSTADELYQKTFCSLVKLQACPDQTDFIPRYNRAFLRRELQIFNEWFVENLLGYSLNDSENRLLDDVFSVLESNALEQTQSLVHRDFHSRNLLLRADDTLGVIDFQGVLWGPCTYDLVSLLRDCYVRWPTRQVINWALTYRKMAIDSAVLNDGIDEETYLRWFDLTGLQRHIKVLGIFARLTLRDKKPDYLDDLPLVVRYTLEVAQTYAELKPFADWFSITLLPLIKLQPWYKDYQTAGEAK